jgi:DNA-binding response OmpR family regulator
MSIEHYGHLKLLFVEDASHTRLMLREMLRNAQWAHAEFVDNATAALERLKTNPPDILFTDWQAQGESGLDLVRAIRESLDSPDPLLPVILLTANGDADNVMSALNAGATDFLVKPISISRIVERVTNAVTRQRPFILSPSYMGPDRRNAAKAVDGDKRAEVDPQPDTIVLPPDGLLLAKVRGDPATIREAARLRAEAIAVVRDFIRQRQQAAQEVVPG